MRISDWSSDVCSSDLFRHPVGAGANGIQRHSFRPDLFIILVRIDRDGGSQILQRGRKRLFHQDANSEVIYLLSGPDPVHHLGIDHRCLWRRNAVQRVDDVVGVERLAVVERNALAQAELKRSEEHTSELQSLMRNSYAVFCLKKTTKNK